MIYYSGFRSPIVQHAQKHTRDQITKAASWMRHGSEKADRIGRGVLKFDLGGIEAAIDHLRYFPASIDEGRMLEFAADKPVAIQFDGARKILFFSNHGLPFSSIKNSEVHSLKPDPNILN